MTPDESIVADVSANPGAKVHEVCARTRSGRSTAYRRINALLGSGQLTRVADGGLFVPSASENADRADTPLCAALMTACYALLASDVSDERKATVLGNPHFKAGLLRGA